MEKISITKGLVELKMLDKRIASKIKDSVFASYNIAGGAVQGFKSPEEFLEVAKASFQSVNDLISRRESIKSGIVESNALTKVTIAGEEMTVAAAIERKNHSVEYDQQFLSKLKSDFRKSYDAVERHNEEASRRLDARLQELAGSDRKLNKEDTEHTTEFFWKNNKADVADAINIREVIDGKQDKIDSFLAEVDTALSISNATTFIEIA